MRYALIAAILLISTARATEPAPRFAAFPVTGMYEGRNAQPILNSGYARAYRARIRDAARNMRPNFAGEYIVVTWGCGTSCEQITFISARTGEVIHPPISAMGGEAIFDIEKSDDYERVVSNVNSRLLLVKGKTNESQEFDGYRYYTFDGQNLTHLKTIIVKPKEDQQSSLTAETTSAPPPGQTASPDECKWSKASRTDQTIKCPNDGAPAVYIENRIAMYGYPAIDIDPNTGQAIPGRKVARAVGNSTTNGSSSLTKSQGSNPAPLASNNARDGAFWRAKAMVREYAARSGETPEQFSTRVGSPLTKVESLVYGFIQTGGDPNGALKSLEGFNDAMKNPLKRKLVDCLLDNPPYGPKPSPEECASVERQLGLPPTKR